MLGWALDSHTQSCSWAREFMSSLPLDIGLVFSPWGVRGVKTLFLVSRRGSRLLSGPPGRVPVADSRITYLEWGALIFGAP